MSAVPCGEPYVFMPHVSGKPGFCYKICRCITLPVGLCIHGSLAVAGGGNGDAARRLAPWSLITTDNLYNILRTNL